MSFWFIVWKSLWRRPIRSLLTILGVGLGVGAGVGMTALAMGFQHSLQGTYRARGTDAVVAHFTSKSPMPMVFDQSCSAQIAAMAGVASVASADFDLLSFDGGPSTVVYAWEPGSYLWEHVTFTAGAIQSGQAAGQGIYLGTVCAQMLGKKLGDTVKIEGHALRVAGLYHSDALIENSGSVLPLPLFQSLLGREGKVKHLNLRLKPDTTPERFEQLRQEIQRGFSGLRLYRAGDVLRDNTGVRLSKAMSATTSTLGFVLACLGVMNTLLMSVFERTAEIGLLMAVGWSRRRIGALILLESVWLSLAGALVGIVFGLFEARAIETLEFVRGRIEAEFSPGLLGAALAVGVLLGIMGGLYPAMRATSLSPDAAMRRLAQR